MRTLETVKHDLFRVSRNALLALFLIPGLSFLFIQHVQSTWNREFVERTMRQVEADATVSSERKAKLVALFIGADPRRSSMPAQGVPPVSSSFLAGILEQGFQKIVFLP